MNKQCAFNCKKERHSEKLEETRRKDSVPEKSIDFHCLQKNCHKRTIHQTNNFSLSKEDSNKNRKKQDQSINQKKEKGEET